MLGFRQQQQYPIHMLRFSQSHRPPTDRKVTGNDQNLTCHTFTNSSYIFNLNDLKFGVDTLKKCAMKSYQKLSFLIKGVVAVGWIF